MAIYNLTAAPILQKINNREASFTRRIYASGNLIVAVSATIVDIAIGIFAKLGAGISRNKNLDRFAIRQYKGAFNRVKKCWDSVFKKHTKLSWETVKFPKDIKDGESGFFGDFFILSSEGKYIIYKKEKNNFAQKCTVPEVIIDPLSSKEYSTLYMIHQGNFLYVTYYPDFRTKIYDITKGQEVHNIQKTTRTCYLGNKHVAFFQYESKKIDIYEPGKWRRILASKSYSEVFLSQNYLIFSTNDSDKVRFEIYTRDNLLVPKQILKLENVKEYYQQGNKILVELDDGTFKTLLITKKKEALKASFFSII